ncbi:hypothetical protein Tco_0386463 [Tanacetum coccineum]
MGCCLTSWFSKKQTALAISTTKAEYVGARKVTSTFTITPRLFCGQRFHDKGMLLTRFVSNMLFHLHKLAIESPAPSYDRVMHPLALHYERKTRSDHGKKSPRDSNASSSSTTLNHPSSFHPLDDIVDDNDEESLLFNPFPPLQNISSSSNVVSRFL